MKIIHIVPTSYGGGVETAAKSFLNYSCKSFIFKVVFLQNRKLDSPLLTYLSSFKTIYNLKPNIILTSLWKSNFITLWYKVINPKVRLILFLHSSENKHLVDKIMTSITAFFAFEIWADSEYTLKKRVSKLLFFQNQKSKFFKNKNKRVISLVTEKLEPFKKNNCNSSFIYWGRLSPEKNLDKAIKLFSKICKIKNESSFTIIGPDYGVKEFINSEIIKLGLKKNIFIHDYMSLKEIKEFAKKSSFFIQLSSYEGMGMSVSESMQLGLIPIVTAVGQISSYCKNMQNSLIYNNNDEEIVANISSILSSSEEYFNIRKKAIKTWQNTRVYKEDIISGFKNMNSF